MKERPPAQLAYGDLFTEIVVSATGPDHRTGADHSWVVTISLLFARIEQWATPAALNRSKPILKCSDVEIPRLGVGSAVRDSGHVAVSSRMTPS